MKLNENTKISGSRTILIPYEANHVLKYHRWMEDEEIRRLTGSEPLSLDEEYEMQKSWRNDEDKLTFIVISRQRLLEGCSEEESMVGDVNLFIDLEDKSAEVEVMIAEKWARRKGFASEALQMILGYGARQLHIERFFAKITDDNDASLHLFGEKLGFNRVSHSEVFKEHTLESKEQNIESYIKDLELFKIANYKE